MQKKKQKDRKPYKLDGTERSGLVIAHFGAMVDVEDEEGNVYHCHLRRNAEPCITGDRVLWRFEQEKTGVIVDMIPRQSLLARPENKGKVKLIAANIDTMVIVTAPLPLLSERLIDRYLVAAENVKIRPLILLNKIDLLDEKSRKEIQSRLSNYEKIGYRLINSSIYLENGLDQIKNVLMDKIGVLVGVSGVGKSSIIARMTNDPDIVIGSMSQAAGLGKHTTTTTRLYHLPNRGHLIDSPGVREFSLGYLTKEQILDGFIEFQPYRGQCEFRNCQHHLETGCALLKALSENKISANRWESYCDILNGNG